MPLLPVYTSLYCLLMAEGNQDKLGLPWQHEQVDVVAAALYKELGSILCEMSQHTPALFWFVPFRPAFVGPIQVLT